MSAKVCVKRELIRELVEKIKTAATFIKAENPDNIIELLPCDFDDLSNFARELIEEFRIPLYYCPRIDYTEKLEKLVAAKNEKEFIDALKQYAEAIHDCAKVEEESAILLLEHYTLDHIGEISELVSEDEIYYSFFGDDTETAYISIFKEKRKLFTKSIVIYRAELYLPKRLLIKKIDPDNIDCVIKEIDELVAEYENSELTSYELYERIADIL